MGHTSDFLVSRSSFVEGFGRIFDFAGALNVYATSPSPEEADAAAMASDFGMVGQDLRQAIAHERAQQKAGSEAGCVAAS
jgi:hypothetical protein